MLYPVIIDPEIPSLIPGIIDNLYGSSLNIGSPINQYFKNMDFPYTNLSNVKYSFELNISSVMMI